MIQIPLKADHHWPASETSFILMAFCWRTDDGLILNDGLVVL